MRAYQSADGSATGSTLCMSPERRLNRAIMLLCGPQALPDPQLCTVECCSGARNVHFLQQLDPAGLSGSCAEGRGPRPTRPVHDHGTFSRLFLEKPLCPCGGRRTGVKMAGGTARDAVGLLVRSRPWKSLALGAGHPKGPLIVASSTRVSFSALPPVPRAVPARQASSPGREEVRDGWTR